MSPSFFGLRNASPRAAESSGCCAFIQDPMIPGALVCEIDGRWNIVILQNLKPKI